MSRSRRKPVAKQYRRNEKKGTRYWRTVRRVTNEKIKYLREDMDDNVLPIPKEIINDYDYSDYTFDMRFRNDEISKKESRK
jgi:hypothetical protein